MSSASSSGPTRIRKIGAIVALTVLSACAAPQGQGINDPYEAHNREVHEINKDIDRTVLRPVSRGYGSTVPAPVRGGVSRFSANLDLPGMVVNDLLQFRAEDAIVNSARFLLNSTVGLAGLFDPASDIGLYERETDFGETLHVWGVGEGAYVELPFLGPSTERDMVGKVVDVALNPTRLLFSDELRAAGTVASVADVANERYEYSETIDSVLYESADSYAQGRLLYLQNRRFELQGEAKPTYSDPYEDPYAQ